MWQGRGRFPAKPSACRCVRLSSPALQPRAWCKFPGERRQLNAPGASARSWSGSTKRRVTPGSQGDTGRSRFRATKGEKRFVSTKPESASPPSFCSPTASRSRAGVARRGLLAAVPPGPGLALPVPRLGPCFFSASGKRQRRRMKRRGRKWSAGTQCPAVLLLRGEKGGA